MRSLALFFVFLLSVQTHAGAPAGSVEDRVSRLLQEKILFTGPNCFNSALRALGMQTQRRHIVENEMKFILRNFCRQSPRLAAGSLGILRSAAESTPLHGFVPLDGALVFTKNGFSKKALHEIQPESRMYEIHNLASRKLCERNGASPCPDLVTDYYVCAPLVEFPLESLMTRIQESRETAFSPGIQELYLEQRNQLMSSPLSHSLCEARSLLLESLRASWEFIEYGSITPEESAGVKRLLLLSENPPPPCPF